MRPPRAIHVNEVGGLRLEIFHDRLDGRTEGACLHQLISLLHRNAARDHEAHDEPYFFLSPARRLEAGGRYPPGHRMPSLKTWRELSLELRACEVLRIPFSRNTNVALCRAGTSPTTCDR